MRRQLNILISAALVSTIITAAGGAPQPPIGVYDRKAILVAYLRSDLWNQVMKAKVAERDQARKAGDKLRVARLNIWGQSQQARVHLQFFGLAPMDNIESAMAPIFRETQQVTGVRLIVPSGTWFKSGPTVDVTDALVERLKPTPKTLEMIRKMRSK